MADGGHDRIDELRHLQRSIEMQYLVLDTAARSRCFEEYYDLHVHVCAPSWIGQADDSGYEFWKITKYVTGFAVCLLWCFVYE